MFFLKKNQGFSKLPPSLQTIKEELMEKSEALSSLLPTVEPISKEDELLIDKINKQTNILNRNNVTRTKAYLDFYKNHPEIHWAFLGHMVSRNGGWNMTDLRGDFLSALMTKKECTSFFSFLERGNWLIFQDAYPQFLLYEESQKRGKPLFYLLAQFQVSTFMETIWNYFYIYHDRKMLTIALIINEQSYLEERVVQNPEYQNNVFNTLEFLLQELFSFSHILFPYRKNGKIKLIGEPLGQFASLEERINLGKRLYSLLFRDKTRLEHIFHWAMAHPHTGTRADYWPHLFHPVKEEAPSKMYRLRLSSCRVRRGAPRLYSPELQYAWKNVTHKSAETGDWFRDWKVVEELIYQEEKVDGEIEREYCQALEKLELAVVAKKTLSIWK